jgi:DNA (cytosine-5)-methyltransferase 1
MSKPILLDLFCGAGGAAMGYHRAGFDVVGVDIEPQPNYPFRFVEGDALAVLRSVMESAPGWESPAWSFDAIHASPPCQRYSVASKSHNGRAGEHPDLIDPTRRLLEQTGLPYVIENVPGAPLCDPVMLCGTMFPGLRVTRHRLFETNFPLNAPTHGKHQLHYTRDKRKPHYGRLDEMGAFVTVTGGGNCSKAAAADAMGIDWMTKDEMNQAIPPAYAEWVGSYLMAETAWVRRWEAA